MRRLINKLTGSEMWVADSRVKEYMAAGHVLAASPEAEKPAEPEEQEPEIIEESEIEKEPEPKPAKAKTRKRTRR